uniref:DUF7705 domain-containing protein n=1 Tax=Nelumbo nucifera TaxID=4432 RepID=A0A822ZCX9_NELNU|nr:TPA_asm: hypothetical protein HUJ06_001222 [Nelumbo nucifera]
MRSCWQNDGLRCEGNSRIDADQYFRMILSPNTGALFSPTNLACSPYHISHGGSPPIYCNDTSNFPYEANHSYCATNNAKHLEEPYQICSPYGNPMPRDIIKIPPHPVWESYGFWKKQGDEWISDLRKWKLRAG